MGKNGRVNSTQLFYQWNQKPKKLLAQAQYLLTMNLKIAILYTVHMTNLFTTGVDGWQGLLQLEGDGEHLLWSVPAP